MKKRFTDSRAGVVMGFTLLLAAAVAWGHRKSDWRAPEEAKKLKNPVPANETTLAAGKAVYLDKCASCHGETGDGKGEQASLYSVKPPDFTESEMMDEMTDGELFWKVSEGRRPMPGFKKQLSEEQRWQVVNYIRTFAKKPEPGAKKH